MKAQGGYGSRALVPVFGRILKDCQQVGSCRATRPTEDLSRVPTWLGPCGQTGIPRPAAAGIAISVPSQTTTDSTSFPSAAFSSALAPTVHQDQARPRRPPTGPIFFSLSKSLLASHCVTVRPE